jgi:hypothetical protein
MSVLRNMSPCKALKRILHGDTVDAILSGESRYADSTFSKALPCLNNLLFIKFCQWNFHSVWLSFFGYFVCYIVSIRTNEEVVGIHTRRIVAFMKNLQAIRDWAMRQYPRDTVGSDRLIVKSSLPVTLEACAPLPFPTIIWAKHLYLRPEMFRNGWRAATASMMSVNKAFWLTLNVTVLVFIPCRNRCYLSTATFAITVGNFIRGIIEGHGNSPFLCLIQGRGANTSPGVFVDFYSFILAQMGEYLNYPAHRIQAVRDGARL